MADQNFRVKRGLEVGIGGTVLNATATGLVGIGTTNPISKLHVIGDAIISGITTISDIVLASSTNSSKISTRNNRNLTIESTGGTVFLDSNTYTTGIATHTAPFFGTQAIFTGVVTASSFSGNASSAIYATTAGIATYASNAGVATYATIAGIATYASNAGVATYATIAGIATYASNAGVATYADTAGIASALTSTASVNTTGIITAAQLSTGASGIGINTDTISGPSIMYIDPAPVGVGTTSGIVRIRGDLYVDGTQFVVNSSTIELSDLRVGIATTVGTNLLLDGGGIGIGSANIVKTITWNNSASALTSSEDWNLVSGKQYEINGTSVLSSNTLGSGVVNSSLTSVGTLGQLNVSGIATVASDLYIGAQRLFENVTNFFVRSPGNIFLQNTDGSQYAAFISGAETRLYYSNLKQFETTGAGATVFGLLDTQTLNVSGIATHGASLFGTQASFTGVVTASSFSGNATSSTYATAAGVATYASTAGISTYSNTSGVSTNVIGGIGSITQLRVTGVSTFTNGPVFVGSGTSTGTSDQKLQITGGAYISGSVGIGTTNPTTKLHVIGDVLVSGVVTASSFTGNASSATYATLAGIATYATTAGVSTYATTSGIATYASSAGIATYATTAGVSTYATTSGIATYASSAGIATYATTAGVSTYATTSGIATYASSAGIATYATSAGLSTDATNANYINITTQTSDDNVYYVPFESGIGYTSLYIDTPFYYNPGQNKLTVTNIDVVDVNSTGVVTASSFSGNASSATYASSAGIATYATLAGIASYASVSGIATYATLAGISSYADVAGIATYATLAGIASYVDIAGISTNVIGGIGSITQLNVSGVSTFTGNVSFGSSAFFGDNDRLNFGDSNDLQIYHDSATNRSYIQEFGAGALFIQGSDLYLTDDDGTNMLYAANNAGVSLYHSGAERLRTTGYGATIFGILETQGLFSSGVSTTQTLNVGTGGTVITTTSDGLVGINSTVPTQKLDIVGTTRIQSDILTQFETLLTGSTVKIQNTSSTDTIAPSVTLQQARNLSNFSFGDELASFNYADQSSTIRSRIGFIKDTSGSAITLSANYVSGLTGIRNGVIIRESGNTGIGTTNPTSKLQVQGDARITGAVYDSSNSPGTSGQVLQSTVSGTQWVNASSSGITIRDEGTIVGGAGSVSTLNFVGAIVSAASTAGIATITFLDYVSNAGVATYATSAGIATYATTAGIATYASTAGVATALQNTRTFEITGDIIASPISFNGTGNVSLAATIQPNSVALGSDTTGDYVQSISGTSNQITVTSGTGEGSTPTLSIPNQFTAPQDVEITRDLQVNRNLNVNGNITIGGTSAVIFSQTLNVYDPDIVLGYRTDAFGNDVSNDNTANHGGVAVASTEGNPLVQLFIAGIETNPATYKKIMWFKAGEFVGLGTDAWLFNYAVGIGSTQFPTGTRLAAGAVQFTENDLAVVRNINASGIVTANSFRGDGSQLTGINAAGGISTYASTAGIATYAITAGVSTNVIGGIASVTALTVSGVSTFSGITTSTSTLFGIQASFSGIITANSFRGDGSQLTGINAAGGISTYAITAGVSTNVIGGIASVTALTVSGVSTFSGIATHTVSLFGTQASFSGIITAIDFNSASDAKLKTNIQPIADPLEKVIRIKGVSFNWIKDNKPSMGVIADELQKVLPELVTDTDPKTVNYNGLIGLLIEVVKEQQIKIESLEERITRLE